MIFKIIEVLVNLIEPLLLFVVLIKKLELKRNCLVPAIFGIIVLGTVTTVLNKAGVGYVLTFLINLTLHILYAIILFNGKLAHRLLWGLSIMFILFITNGLSYLTFDILGNPGELLSPSLDRVIMMSVYCLLNVTLTIILLRFNEKNRIMPIYIIIIVMLLCIIGGASIYSLLGQIAELTEHNMSVVRCVIPVFSIILFIMMILTLLDTVSKSIKKQMDTRAELTVYNIKKEYEENILAMADTYRAIRHDYANHMATVTGFIKGKDWDGLTAYVNAYNTEYDINRHFATGYTVIDSILTSKALSCERNNIEFNVAVKVSGNIPLSELEQTMIFGNLLDNAIEAQKTVNGKKYIDITVETIRGQFFITLENSSSGKYIFRKNELATSKADALSHGYGLKIVKDVIKKHNGSIVIEPKEDIFIVEISLASTYQAIGECIEAKN